MGFTHQRHVVILGSSLAGFHTALALSRALPDHRITVLSREEELTLRPSLALLPFRLRDAADVAVPARPLLGAHGVGFVHDQAVRVDLDRRMVITRSGATRYDYLVVATGAAPSYAAVPGLGPSRYTCSITTLGEAEQTRAAFERLLEAPGPIVVGALGNGIGYVPAHDFLFSLAGQIRRRDLSARAPITYLTTAPDVGHLGRSGLASAIQVDEPMLADLGIRVVTRGLVRQIDPGAVRLVDGRSLPFSFAMLIPPFLGADVIRGCDRLTTASGFVRVDDGFRSTVLPEIFAVGAAAAAAADPRTCDPWDAGRWAGPLQEIGETVAAAIARDIALGAEARSESPVASAC